MQRYNHFGSLAKLFVVLLILSWTFTRLPFTVKISGEYFRKLFTVIVSPLFVFILFNGIIVSLILAKSGRFSGQNQSANNNVEAEIYQEIIKNNSECTRSESESESESETQPQPSAIEDDAVYEDKHVISEVSTIESEVETDTDSDPDSDHPKPFKRLRFLRQESLSIVLPNQS